MRTPTLLLLTTALFLTAGTAYAVGTAAKEDFVPSFGQTYCKPTVPCPSSAKPDEMPIIEKQSLTTANNCVKRRFLTKSEMDSFFDESYGLDSKLCLRSKPMPKSKSGLALTPECCLRPSSQNADQCNVVCSLLGKQ